MANQRVDVLFFYVFALFVSWFQLLEYIPPLLHSDVSDTRLLLSLYFNI